MRDGRLTSLARGMLRAMLAGITLTLAGCGLAETAVTGAAGAAQEAQQAQAAQQQLDQTRAALDAAQKSAEEQRERALKEAGQ